MDLSLIKELYDKGLCTFAESFNDWKEAVSFACKPLIEKGYIESGYVEGIYENVDKNGLYIFLAPHICMPHCGKFNYVHKNCLSFMKCNTPVIGDPNEPEMGAELFFVLATTNETQHIEEIQRLATMLENNEIIEALLSIRNEKDLVEMLLQSDIK